MSAVLIVLAQRYRLTGIWIAGALAGALLLVIGLLRLGRYIAFIPAPVISGFTTGIALIIFIGQVDNFLGIHSEATESAALKVLGYFRSDFTLNWPAIILGLIVVATMVLWPRKWAARLPSSLLGIILATLASALLGWQVDDIGAIPQTLLLDDRLSLAAIPWSDLTDFIAPTLTITALGAVESLLCGAVASHMTGIRMQANQELIAQGVGNILIPFFGGVPATAAIARTSVGIKSGGRTRMVSIIHALALLASMFALAPLMSRIPLSALAGVLMVTAWRMNEWEAIRFIFGGVFLNQIASLQMDVTRVDPDKLRQRGIETRGHCSHVRVAYLTGPVFFAATGTFNEAVGNMGPTNVLVLSMRGVSLLDTSGLQVVMALQGRLHKAGGHLKISGVHDNVRRMMQRGSLVDAVGAGNFFWSAHQAIVAAERLGCPHCGPALFAALPLAGAAA